MQSKFKHPENLLVSGLHRVSPPPPPLSRKTSQMTHSGPEPALELWEVHFLIGEDPRQHGNPLYLRNHLECGFIPFTSSTRYEATTKVSNIRGPHLSCLEGGLTCDLNSLINLCVILHHPWMEMDYLVTLVHMLLYHKLFTKSEGVIQLGDYRPIPDVLAPGLVNHSRPRPSSHFSVGNPSNRLTLAKWEGDRHGGGVRYRRTTQSLSFFSSTHEAE